MTEWRQNQKIVAEKSPTYWNRNDVKLDEIDFLPIESADTEERMFRAGQIDITYEVPLTKIALYQRESPKNILLAPWCAVYFYRFNVARKPLDDVRVRRALSMAIEREKLVKYVTLGGEQPALSYIPPETAGYVGKDKNVENVAEAKKLLAEAGFPDGKGFPHLQLLYNTTERHRSIAEAIQEMWRRNLGIDITLTNEEWKVFLVDQRTINFDIQRAGWQADYLDPNVFFDLWRTGGGNNCTNWGSPEYDRLLDDSLNAKTRDERYATYQKMEKIILDEQPIIPLYFYTDAKLISNRVLSYKITPLDDYPWKDVDVVSDAASHSIQ
jgi:oligopeptide transport system substrate-binding protein